MQLCLDTVVGYTMEQWGFQTFGHMKSYLRYLLFNFGRWHRILFLHSSGLECRINCSCGTLVVTGILVVIDCVVSRSLGFFSMDVPAANNYVFIGDLDTNLSL